MFNVNMSLFYPPSQIKNVIVNMASQKKQVSKEAEYKQEKLNMIV